MTRRLKPASRKFNTRTTSSLTRKSGPATISLAPPRSTEWLLPVNGRAAAVSGPLASEARGLRTLTFPTCSVHSAAHPEAGEGGASIFEDLMGRVRGSRPTKQRAGRSIEANLIIPFLTAVRGGETTIELQRGHEQAREPGRQNSAGHRHRGQAPFERPGRAGNQKLARRRFDDYRPG